MAKVVVPDYTDDLNAALTQLVDIIDQDVYEVKKRLERELRRLNKRFYSIMAQKIIGALSAPNLGAFTPQWKPLSANTVQRKGHSRFYEQSGALAEWLQKANANDLIGDPEVFIQTGGKTGTIKGTTRTFLRVSPRGKKWVQHVGIGPKGRFVSTKDLEQHLHPRLIVYPFGLKNSHLAAGGNIVWKAVGGDKTIAWKLINYKGQEDRPIFENYLRWWLNIQVKRVVEKYGK